jgi:hypothetical protein
LAASKTGGDSGAASAMGVGSDLLDCQRLAMSSFIEPALIAFRTTAERPEPSAHGTVERPIPNAVTQAEEIVPGPAIRATHRRWAEGLERTCQSTQDRVLRPDRYQPGCEPRKSEYTAETAFLPGRERGPEFGRDLPGESVAVISFLVGARRFLLRSSCGDWRRRGATGSGEAAGRGGR